MKKIKTLLLVIIAVLILPARVLAANKPIVVDAPSTSSKGEEISVTIKLFSGVAINEFKATLSYETTALELLSIENKNNWEQVSTFSEQSPLSLEFTHEDGITGETTVAVVKFRVKDDVAKTNTNFTIEGTTKTKSDGTVNVLEKVTKKMDIRSTDNSLKDLKVNGETVGNFSPNVYNYELLVDASVTTANFEATLNDKTATFKNKYAPKTGASLDYGENIFEIIVVSASKEEKKYTIKITRQDNRGTNNKLASITINSNPRLLDFKENTLTYTITTHKLKTIDVVAEPQDPKAKVEIKKEDELKIGENEIKIIVTSEKDEKNTYTIIVNNLDREIDTSLSDLILYGCDEDIDFHKEKFDYEVLYKSKYNSDLVIKPKVNNSDEAEFVIDKDLSTLKAGDKISIKVTPKDGTTGVESIYTITFKKDNRLNFFLILGTFIFIVLLIIFIKLLINNRKEKKRVMEIEKDLVTTKRIEKINLE